MLRHLLLQLPRRKVSFGSLLQSRVAEKDLRKGLEGETMCHRTRDYQPLLLRFVVGESMPDGQAYLSCVGHNSSAAKS